MTPDRGRRPTRQSSMEDRPFPDVTVELQHRHRIMVHALRVILDDAENAGAVKTRERLERLYDELRSNRPMAEWSLQRLLGNA